MNQLPAHLQKFQSRDLGSTLSANLGAASPPYISIAGGRFTAIDAAGNEMGVGGFDQQLGVYVDACIIDAGDHISRTFYEKEYDPSATTFSPPDCFSDNGVGPSVNCSRPQAPTCAACQWSVWGSATSAQGKPIPACQQVQKLALVVPTIPQVVFLLRVPPNSHKNLRAYNELSKRNGAQVTDLLTRIYFDRTTQGTLLFTAVNWIDEATAVARQAAYDEKKTDNIVGRLDVARQGPAQLARSHGQTDGQVAQLENHLQNPTQQAAPIFNQPQHTGLAQPAVTPSPQPMAATSAGQAPMAEQAAPARRRRRAAADPAPAGQQATGPASAPQPPFPVNGQGAGQGQMPAAQPAAQAQPNNFGMAQPTQPAADVAAQLDSFFGKA